MDYRTFWTPGNSRAPGLPGLGLPAPLELPGRVGIITAMRTAGGRAERLDPSSYRLTVSHSEMRITLGRLNVRGLARVGVKKWDVTARVYERFRAVAP